MCRSILRLTVEQPAPSSRSSDREPGHLALATALAVARGQSPPQQEGRVGLGDTGGCLAAKSVQMLLMILTREFGGLSREKIVLVIADETVPSGLSR